MNKEEESIYLQNIEEYIFEENKIVTYQWLCKSLDIHVNVSKQLLYTFATQGCKKDELSITYLLAGVPKDGLGYHVAVVKDSTLAEAKKAFQAISSEHVYSVQKANAISDLNVLYTVDISDDHKNNNYKRLSSIEFESVERDSAVIAVLRAEALPTVSKQPIASLKKPVSKTSKPIEKSPKKQVSPKKHISPKKQTSPKKYSKEDKGQVKQNNSKPTVASMFAKAAANKKPTTATNTAAKTVKDTKPKGKGAGIGAFFKAPVKPKEDVSSKNEKKTDIKMEVDEDIPVVSKSKASKDNCVENKPTKDKPDVKDKIEDKPAVKDKTKDKPDVKDKIEDKPAVKDKTKDKPDSRKKEISPKVQSKTNKTKDSETLVKVKEYKGKKRAKKSNDEEKVVKKRKRIVVMSESESSNDEDESHLMERDSTPPPQPTVVEEEEDEDVIEGTPQPLSKRHRRRLVDKTFTDEEGYMYTKKEYVTESCSDEEDTTEVEKDSKKTEEKEKVVAKKTEVKKNSKQASKKQASPHKTKQTNLMSFFGKKS